MSNMITTMGILLFVLFMIKYQLQLLGILIG